MSIVWEQVQGGTRYQVRRAGGSLRLYTNGVLHSQYNAARPLTGSVWDLLTVPAFLLAPGAVQEQQALAATADAAMQLLSSAGVDWRFGVTTTETWQLDEPSPLTLAHDP